MFTLIESAIGSLLIQAATSSYIHLEGKVVGFSSVLYNSVFSPSIHAVSIMTGMFLSAKFIGKFLPAFASEIVPVVSDSLSFQYGNPLRLLIAGLIVGFGTSAGCGCTSGHMLIGMSRLRWRSFVATCVFFTTAVITTFVSGNYKQVGCGETPCYKFDSNFTTFKENSTTLLSLVIVGQVWSYLVLPKIGKWLKDNDTKKDGSTDNIIRSILGVSAGFLFGCGLAIAGMTDATKVTGFLSFFQPEKFDPSLAMIPIFCILPNIFLWKKWLPQTAEEARPTSEDGKAKGDKLKVKVPLFEKKYDLPFSNATDVKFLIGNAIFGIGWGLAGVCPGPGILTMFSELGAFTIGRGVLYITGFLTGSYIQKHA